MTPSLKRLIPLFAGVLIISMAACAPLPNPIPTPTQAPVFPTATAGIPVTSGNLTNTDWKLVSSTQAGTETPVLPSSNPTLTFQENGQVDGFGGCNSFGGQYQVQGSTIL